MKTTSKLVLIFSVLVISTACATSKPALEGQLNSDFGSAVKYNTAQHAVPASQAQKENTYIPANRARTALARKNYEENKVTPLDSVNSRDSE